MKNRNREIEYQEFFRGNHEEIEKERSVKRALIHYLPKLVGEVDRTQYILCDDNIPNTNNFGYATPKESKQAQSDNYWKNNKPYDFDTKENVHPLTDNSSMQQNAFSGLNNSKPQVSRQLALGSEKKLLRETRPKPVVNDSIRFDTRETNHKTDSSWYTYSNPDTAFNNTPKANDTEPKKKKTRLRWSPTKENYTAQINELKAQLPKGVLNVLNEMGTEIRVVDHLHTINNKDEIKKRNGIYNANKITIDSKHVSYNTLFAETVHAVQNYLGMTGLGKANLEFQEHVIKDLYFQHKLRETGLNQYSNGGFSNSDDDRYIKLISKALDKDGILDLNKFIIDIENYIDEFQENYKPSNSYQEPTIKQFNYNWINLFDIFEIPYK